MCKICVFGGTTEGRELAEFLNTQPCETIVCVATEYGQTLLPSSDHLSVSARRLPVDEIVAMLRREQFDLVVDATHPYAVSITKSIANACRETGTECWRLLRGASSVSLDAVFVRDTQEAVDFLSRTEGNILLTTGSKELESAASLDDIVQTALSEAQIESLVIAKGYADCVAYMSGDGISVAVSSPEGGLQQADVAVIADIVMSQSDYALGDIRVVEVQ